MLGLPFLHPVQRVLGPQSDTGPAVHGDLVAERHDDANTQLLGARVVGIERPRDRGPGVVELGAKPTPNDELVAAQQLRSELFGELGVVLGVPSAPLVGLTQLVDAFACVGPQCLEHPVAGHASGGVVDRDHRLGHEAPERVEDVPRLDARTGDDRLSGSTVEVAREDAEPVEHCLLRRSSSEYDQSTVARRV